MTAPVVPTPADYKWVDTIRGMWKTGAEAASWLARTIGVRATIGGISAVAFAVALGVLLRADAIKGLLVERHPIWAQMIEPIASAGLMGALWFLGLVVGPSALKTVSPRYRLRRMATEAAALAESLSSETSYYYEWDATKGWGPPLPRLEAEIALIRAHLRDLRVRSPPASDGDAWRGYISLLRRWIAAGDLRAARAYCSPQHHTKAS